MTGEITVTTILIAAINALVAVILANHKGLWVSGREFRELKAANAALEVRIGTLEAKLDRQHERYVEAVAHAGRAVTVAHDLVQAKGAA